MLTETAFESRWSGRESGQATRKGFPAACNDSMRSIELIGASMSFRRNAEIYGEREPADYLYKVVSGAARTCKVRLDGRRQIGAFYLPGDIFGLETGDEHTLSAEAVIPSKIVVIKRATVISLAGRDIDAAHQLWTLTTRELRRTQNHLLFLNKTAPERVAGFLLEMAERAEFEGEIELPMPRQDIADYLGLSIETVSRMLRQFENASAIALPAPRRIVLRKRAVLKGLIA